MPTKREAERLQQEASAVRAEIGLIQTQLAFLDQVVASEKWCAPPECGGHPCRRHAELDDHLRGQLISMQGHTPNLRTAARYLLNALRNPKWTQVTINGPQGYPSTASPADVHPRFRPMDYPLQITATLARAHRVNMPQPPGGGGGGGGGMPGGMPGDPGMGPGPGMEGMPPDAGAPPGAP